MGVLKATKIHEGNAPFLGMKFWCKVNQPRDGVRKRKVSNMCLARCAKTASPTVIHLAQFQPV